ncbi:MAG: hypothetical protein M1834_009485 [Cirrosporium novae-zelandiae]|nr:MAG: hypothetical protein M1834_009485 [Cirrosporium novae-zelandiae]
MSKWWNQEHINLTVTRNFILSNLQPHHQQLLSYSVSFGAGLTDASYLDWIIEKAKRLFLILLDIGTPESIFALIDASYDDSDLPIPSSKMDNMPLATPTNDQSFSQAFYRTQHDYLDRDLTQGSHLRYLPEETVPGQVVEQKQGMPLNNLWSTKVVMPGTVRKVCTRLRIPLDQPPTETKESELLHDIEAIRAYTHEHIVSVWASYTFDNCGFVLLDPVIETTLKVFVNDPPRQFRALPRDTRNEILINWPHCLAEALAFIHRGGCSHGAIRPSNILIDSNYKILLGPLNSMKTLQLASKSSETEAYDYAAPEQFLPDWEGDSYPWPRTEIDSGLSSHHSSWTGEPSPIETALNNEENGYFSKPSSSETNMVQSYFSSASSDTDNDDSSSIFSPTIRTHASSFSSWTSTKANASLAADIFSLGAVILDILTHLLGRRASAFSLHRSTSACRSIPKTVPIPVLLPPVSRNVPNVSDPSMLDSSFHANIPQLVTWMDSLDDAAFARDDQLFRGIPPMLALLPRMLSEISSRRPSAVEVEDRLDDALFRFAHLTDLHCGKGHFAPTPLFGVPFNDVEDTDLDDLDFEGLELNLKKRPNNLRSKSYPIASTRTPPNASNSPLPMEGPTFDSDELFSRLIHFP